VVGQVTLPEIKEVVTLLSVTVIVVMESPWTVLLTLNASVAAVYVNAPKLTAMAYPFGVVLFAGTPA
jgi:hypothetical protein